MPHLASQRDADRNILHEEIDQLQCNAPLDTTQNAHLIALQQQYDALQSPIYSVSDDILAYIFEMGSAGDRSSSFAWTVSHVVSRWRRVALATPRVWTGLSTSLPAKSTLGNEGCTAVLDRSRPFALYVTIGLRELDQYEQQSSFELMQHLALRAHTYNITQCSSFTYPFILPTFTAALTALTLVELELYYSDYLEVISACLSSCRNLRRLCLEYLSGPRRIQYFTPEPQNLVELPLLETLYVADSVACAICAHIRAQPTSMALSLSGLDMVGPWCSALLPRLLDKLNDIQWSTLQASLRHSATGIILQILGAAPKLATLDLRDLQLSTLMVEHHIPNPPRVNRLILRTLSPQIGEGLKDIINGLDPEFFRSSLTVELHHGGDGISDIPRNPQLVETPCPQCSACSPVVFRENPATELHDISNSPFPSTRKPPCSSNSTSSVLLSHTFFIAFFIYRSNNGGRAFSTIRSIHRMTASYHILKTAPMQYVRICLSLASINLRLAPYC